MVPQVWVSSQRLREANALARGHTAGLVTSGRLSEPLSLQLPRSSGYSLYRLQPGLLSLGRNGPVSNQSESSGAEKKCREEGIQSPLC